MGIGKRIVYGLITLVIVIILVVTAFVLYVNLNKTDGPKVDDSSLAPSNKILANEDNAFFDLKEASEHLYWLPEKEDAVNQLVEGTSSWDESLVSELVSKNQSALAAFDKASFKIGFQDLAHQGDLKLLNVDTAVFNLSATRKLAKISSLKSELLFKQGKEKEAFENARNIVYVGQKLQSPDRNSTIAYLIGVSLKNIGLQRMQFMLQQSHLASNDSKKYAASLEKFKENEASLQEMFRMEYTMITNTKEQMVDTYVYQNNPEKLEQSLMQMGLPGDDKGSLSGSGGMWVRSFYYKPNQTQKLFFDQYSSFVDNAGKGCDAMVPAARMIPEENLKSFRMLFTENGIGKILRDVIAVSLDGIFLKKCQEDFNVQKTQIMLATHAYKADKGSFPDTLDKLFPDYLDLSLGKFEGQSLVYDSKTGMVDLAEPITIGEKH